MYIGASGEVEIQDTASQIRHLRSWPALDELKRCRAAGDSPSVIWAWRCWQMLPPSGRVFRYLARSRVAAAKLESEHQSASDASGKAFTAKAVLHHFVVWAGSSHVTSPVFLPRTEVPA